MTEPINRMPTGIFCLPFYFLGLVGLMIEVLPSEAFAIFGRPPRPHSVGIGLLPALAFVAIGATLHVVLYRMSPHRFNVRAFRMVTIAGLSVVIAIPVVSMLLSYGAGISPAEQKSWLDAVRHWTGAILLGFLGLMFTLVVALVGLIALQVKRHPGSRIARRIAAGDNAEAIRIGEACPEAKRDFLTNGNLAIAYALSGDAAKARAILLKMEHVEGIPQYFTEEAKTQFLEQVRTAIESPLTGGETGEATDSRSSQ
jgi:hypothetical protein